MSDVPTVNPDAPKASLPVCAVCGGSLERVQRIGLLQERIMPLFDRFPWRCVLCHDITYRTARHRRALRQQHGVEQP